ncbi:hypothetical protein OROMI_033474 [Orobanche minor]
MTDDQSRPFVPPTSQQSRNRRPESPHRLSKLTKTDRGDFSDGVEEDEEEEKESVETNMSANPRIQRYLVAVEYIGTRFSGAQKQPTDRTVVGALEDAFQKFIGHPVSIFCSSRTDAGVHAISNVCHVDIERTTKRKPGEVLPPHEPSVVKRAVNHFLQDDDWRIVLEKGVFVRLAIKSFDDPERPFPAFDACWLCQDFTCLYNKLSYEE